jgi:hypothetical protein
MGKARNMVPLFDKTVQRIEPYIPPVIETADRYVDAAYGTAESRVTVLKGKKDALGSKVVDLRTAAVGRAWDLVGSAHSLAVVLVGRSEALVDLVLPPDEAEKEAADAARQSGAALSSRVMVLPYQIPVRLTRVVFVQARGLAEITTGKCRYVVQLSSEQTAKLFTSLKHNRVSDKIVSVTAPGVAALRSGSTAASQKLQIAWQSLVDAEQAVVVYVNGQFFILVQRFRLPQLKEWTLVQAECLKQRTADAGVKATEGAYRVTTRVVGGPRAALIFTNVGKYVPIMKKPVGE